MKLSKNSQGTVYVKIKHTLSQYLYNNRKTFHMHFFIHELITDVLALFDFSLIFRNYKQLFDQH